MYAVTDVGRKALRDKIAETLREPAREYPSFPVALAQVHLLPKDHAVELLRERIEHLTGALARADTMHKSAATNAVPRRRWMAPRYVRAMIAAELSWVRNVISDLDAGTVAWEYSGPGSWGRISEKHHGWTATEADEPGVVPERTAETSSTTP